jgi:hypothetical protein
LNNRVQPYLAPDCIFSARYKYTLVGYTSIRSVYVVGKKIAPRAELRICGAPKAKESTTTLITALDKEEKTIGQIELWFYDDDLRTRIIRFYN